MTESARSDRSLWIVVGIIGALVVIALIVVLTRPSAAELDPSSPEGVVQGYAKAVIEGDRESAYEYLAFDGCEQTPLPNVDVRVVLGDTAIHGDTAIVDVAISSQYSGSGIGDSYRYDDYFELARESGEWRITTAPWSLTICYPKENQ